MRLAIERDGRTLEYASDRIKNDRAIVRQAIRTNLGTVLAVELFCDLII